MTVELGKMIGNALHSGMRIIVRRVLSVLATYLDKARLVSNLPDLEEEDLTRAVPFAAKHSDYTASSSLVASRVRLLLDQNFEIPFFA